MRSTFELTTILSDYASVFIYLSEYMDTGRPTHAIINPIGKNKLIDNALLDEKSLFPLTSAGDSSLKPKSQLVKTAIKASPWLGVCNNTCPIANDIVTFQLGSYCKSLIYLIESQNCLKRGSFFVDYRGPFLVFN
jgi:hypothetical protein